MLLYHSFNTKNVIYVKGTAMVASHADGLGARHAHFPTKNA